MAHWINMPVLLLDRVSLLDCGYSVYKYWVDMERVSTYGQLNEFGRGSLRSLLVLKDMIKQGFYVCLHHYVVRLFDILCLFQTIFIIIRWLFDTPDPTTTGLLQRRLHQMTRREWIYIEEIFKGRIAFWFFSKVIYI